MLSSSYQPALRDSLTGWSSKSSNQPVPVKVCLRASQQHLGVTDERVRTKDVWRPKKNGGHLLKCSEVDASASVVAPSLLSLSIRNGLSLVNVGDTSTLCDTAEKDSVKSTTKKPGKDVWRSKKKEGMGTGASGGQVDDWMAKKCNNPVGQVTLSLGSNLLTEDILADKPGVSTSSPKPRKRVSSGKDVWRSRQTEDGPALNLQPLGNMNRSRKRLYLLDIHPLCYNGSRVQPRKILEWMNLLFSEVTQDDPIIAVMDGERGNEYRRALLPSYKAKRNLFRPLPGNSSSCAAKDFRKALHLIHGFFTLCQIPVVKQEFAEADDIIATLARQARDRNFQVVIASPDMDFQQLLTADVHMLLPLPELGRWSFYTLDHYVKQNAVTPDLDLGLKCMLGDLSDNVPGLSVVAPGFGRKTALKLMQKHGSLEKLLTAAASRTVGREYIQEALTKHADLLRRNLQVLSLRTDVDVALEEQWCRPRCVANDGLALDLLNERLRSE